MISHDTAFCELAGGTDGSKLMKRRQRVNYQSKQNELGWTTNLLISDTYALALRHFPAPYHEGNKQAIISPCSHYTFVLVMYLQAELPQGSSHCHAMITWTPALQKVVQVVQVVSVTLGGFLASLSRVFLSARGFCGMDIKNPQTDLHSLHSWSAT